MLRKLTAMMFLLVMALLITLKHPVLGYCLCLDSYFTGDCVCLLEKAAPSELKKTSSDCTSCCANDEANITPPSTPKPAPCDDCTVDLNIDVGDFVWQSSEKSPSDSEVLLPPLALELNTIALPLAASHPTGSIRGDPPPGHHYGNLPLYLRLSVLRL